MQIEKEQIQMPGKGLVYLTAYQLFMGYLTLKFHSFLNV